MSDLFLPTLEMMGLTFAIGFFVAFIIKLIASAADSLDFYSSHQQELLRLRRIKKFRQKMELMLHTPSMHGNIFGNDTREDYSRGVDRENEKPRGYYHGVSHGVSKRNLVDYFYPEDTHMMYLEDASSQPLSIIVPNPWNKVAKSIFSMISLCFWCRCSF